MVDTIPTEPTVAPNAGNEPTEPTSTEPAAEPKKLTFTQEELDKKFQERQLRGEKAAEKKFQKQILDLSAQIEEFKGKDLGELEKLQKRLEKANEDLKKVPDLEMKVTKMEKLLAAGATPEQIPGLLKRVIGTTPDEVESDIKELKDLGWIGKQPEPEPTKPAGLGTPTKTGEPPAKNTNRDLLKEVNAKMSDPKISHREREALLQQSIKLNRLIQKGET
jgi:hypothetical protein